jgi:hypothetical protein
VAIAADAGLLVLALGLGLELPDQQHQLEQPPQVLLIPHGREPARLAALSHQSV